jgi:hypothetical protein
MGRNIRAPRVVLALMSRFLALMSRFSLNGKDAEGQYSTRIRFVASGVNHFQKVFNFITGRLKFHYPRHGILPTVSKKSVFQSFGRKWQKLFQKASSDFPIDIPPLRKLSHTILQLFVGLEMRRQSPFRNLRKYH